MANWDTFSDLKDRVMEEIKDHTDTFFKDAAIGVKINEAERELFKLIHAQKRGFFFSSTPVAVTLSSSTDLHALTNHFAAIDEIIPTNDVDKWRRFDWASRHSEQFRSLRSLAADQLGDQSQFLFDVIGDKTLIVVPKVSTSFSIDVYVYPEPGVMTNPGDVPTVKDLFRNWLVQYAAISLKGSEEAGEQISHQQALDFLTTNISNYISDRGGTNCGVVDGYME